ncbi:MAG: anthranilate synthase component I [Zetaproteobacteria bacterium]|nr:MAG: anthranilate synthase component I [Zetaproteobacteria bacterium]
MKLHRRTRSADCETALTLFARLRAEGACVLFESAEGGERWGRYSIIGFDPAERVVERDGRLHIHHRDGSSRERTGAIESWLRAQVIDRPAIETDLPFSGGAVGYFSYDVVHRFEPGAPQRDACGAVAGFMLIDRFVVVDNLRGVLHLCVTGQDDAAAAILDAIEARLAQPHGLTPLDLAPAEGAVAPQAHCSRAAFEAMVQQARDHIRAGDIFQVVLSQRFSAPLEGDPLTIYRAVRHINPSPYLFYLAIDDTVLVGSSPEILVRKEGRRAIVRPIAGTRPRGADADADAALARELLADAKERAEHVMLVDLGRNDLGRVCRFGSVEVTESMVIERYSHVMHIVSQVEGVLRDGVDAIDLLAATFPAGTVSGAPKVRAMQIIDELEGEARGPYAGCIGYIAFGGGRMDTAIAIRTAVIRDGRVQVQAGAGIVADSDPAREHQECVNKATAMFRAVALAGGNR